MSATWPAAASIAGARSAALRAPGLSAIPKRPARQRANDCSRRSPTRWPGNYATQNCGNCPGNRIGWHEHRPDRTAMTQIAAEQLDVDRITMLSGDAPDE